MAKTFPIKTDLFRFVTYRTPEQIDYLSKSLRFVTHPEIGSSAANACPIPKDGNDKALTDYLKKFPSFPNLKGLRDVNPLFFDFSTNAHKRKLSVSEIERAKKATVSKLNTKEEFQLFEALLGGLMSKQNKEITQGITQMLVVNHVIKYSKELTGLNLKKLTDIKIEIPYEIVICMKRWWYSKCSASLDGVQNLGIADFRRVEQEVCCYIPGEVSHVENVMAKEYKERSTRNFLRTEDTLESSTETEIENLTDVTTATRNEISTEIAQVLEQEKSANYGGSLGVSATWGAATINVNAYADFATSNSSSYANTSAQNYAEEVTKRALERIVQRISEKRTSKIIKEFEETNKHGFDNRNGDKHVTGIYRWLDIIYKNRLINYGKRLMVEFMVPEPAKFYKRMLDFKPANHEAEEGNLPEKPKELSEFNITKPDDIDPQTVLNAASYYGVTLTTLPPSQTTVTKDLSPLAPVSQNRNITTQNLTAVTVPNDYEADIITGSYTYEYRANSATSSQQAFCDFTFGGSIVQSGRHYSATKKNETVNINLNLNPNLSGNIPVSVGYSGCFGFYGAASIKCILKASVIQDWKNDCYNKLQASYNKMLEAYNKAVEDNKQQDEPLLGETNTSSNPALNRIVEQRELKRICIEMLMKPYCHIQGQNHYYDINACDKYQIPQVMQNKALSDYAAIVKLFEQAIDWQIMSYLFYPYYWADKCDWADLMKSENTDLIFQAFLQSGMARVVVPIRQQFTEAFAFYLETGVIWLGNELVAGSENNLYLSIAEEMQTIEGAVEEEWETRVPTTLAIIQGKSAYLEQEGLPCCHNVENNETSSNILPTDNTLQLIQPSK